MDTLILPPKKREQKATIRVDTSILPVKKSEEKSILPVVTSILPEEKSEEKAITPVDTSSSIPVKEEETDIHAAETSEGSRRKIEIKKIENQSRHRQVVFSKRKASVFQKASELCILTGAEIAIIIKSPGKPRFYTFVEPDLDTVIDRYIDEESHDDAEQKIQRTQDAADQVAQLRREYIELCRKLELEKAEAKKARMNVGRGEWWNDDLNGMSMSDLEEYLVMLEQQKKIASSRCEDLNVVQNSKSFNNRLVARHSMDELSAAMFVNPNQENTGIDSRYENLTGPFMF